MSLTRVLHLILVNRLHTVDTSILAEFSAGIERLIFVRLRLSTSDEEETTIGSLNVLEVKRERLVNFHLELVESFGLKVVSQNKLTVTFKEEHFSQLSSFINKPSLTLSYLLLDLLCLYLSFLLRGRSRFRYYTSVSVLIGSSFNLCHVVFSGRISSTFAL